MYKTTDRLLLKPETIGVGLRDFMISIKSRLLFSTLNFHLTLFRRACTIISKVLVVSCHSAPHAVRAIIVGYIGKSQSCH